MAVFLLVSKLSKRISSQESVQRRLETDLEDLRRNHSNLLNKYEVLVGDEQNKMSLQEHLKIMEECRRYEQSSNNLKVQA